MRKRYRVLIFAVIVAAAGVPFGFALSLESENADLAPRGAMIAASAVPAPLATAESRRASNPIAYVSDSAKLFLVGAGLFGIAGAVRRAA